MNNYNSFGFPRIYGPFENPDDINKLWYQVTEKELEKYINQVKKDLKDPDNSKESNRILKQDLKNWTQELNNLRAFIDDYTRSSERYKHNNKLLEQIQQDWSDYNLSLYADWSRIQAMMLDPDMIKGENLKNVQLDAKQEKIKREEIEKRIRDLLDS